MDDSVLEKILATGVAFSKEKKREPLLGKLLEVALDVTACDTGVLYMEKNGAFMPKMWTVHPSCPLSAKEQAQVFAALPEDSVRGLFGGGTDCVYAADMYADGRFAAFEKEDAVLGLRTRSLLLVPLANDKGELGGMLRLCNAKDEKGRIVPFLPQHGQVLLSLGLQAQLCLQNIAYAQQIQDYFDAFVKVMSTAIDARTPYNANHTRNMVVYATRFIRWLNRQKSGWSFNREEKRIFLLSVWLHDIGKLVIPREIMNKQDRLGSNLAHVQARLKNIRLLTKLAQYEGRLDAGEAEDTVLAVADAQQLIVRVNRIRVLTDAMVAQIDELAQRTYEDEDGVIRRWITPQEYSQLTIRSGTLTRKEREVMQSHVEMTRRMLEQMTFTGNYAHILKWASKHHEMLNGSGYPQGLKGGDIPREVRLLTILDIFEALTAEDRPYKPPMPVERSLEILHAMALRQEIDADILALFEKSRAWE